MSSKPATDATRSWSIAGRLTAWYAAAAFALVFVATGYLYWALARNLDHEDDEFLADRAAAIGRVLAERPDDVDAVQQEVLVGGADRGGRFFVRVQPVGKGREAVETPGMDRVLPAEAFPAEGTVDYRAVDGRPFRIRASRDPGSGCAIQAAMDRTHDDHLLAGFRRQLAVVLSVSLLAAAIGGYAIARRGLRPIADVTAIAQRTGPGRLGERIEATGLPAEVRDLAATFNLMLGRLEDAFGRLSRFSADIAHELRTPINNLRGAVEVALGRPRTADEYREVLASCLEECGRLGRLIDGLLFLARAEDPKAVPKAGPVDVELELTAVRDLFDPAAAEAGVRLTVEAEPGLVVGADRELFQRAVSNLVTNGLAHTPAGGTVTLFAGADAASVRVGVRDTGPGIAPADLPYVFDRFYRADAARSDGGRIGLGLAIVRGIAELHGGAAAAISPPGHGTTVTVTFPRWVGK